MKASDIVLESLQYPFVVVCESSDGTRAEFTSPRDRVVLWKHYHARQWVAKNDLGLKIIFPSKAKAYSWALDQTANGSIYRSA